MMGNKKLSAVREEVRAAFEAEGCNPIATLDRRIRKLKAAGKSEEDKSRALALLRGALAQVITEQPAKRVRSARTKRTTKAS
jgi:hypothetical protein